MIISQKKVSIKNHETAAAVLRDALYKIEDANYKEVMLVAGLNNKNVVQYIDVAHIGTANYSPASMRDLFRKAITTGAVRVIVAHNHPSGETEMSPEDVAVTKKLVEAGKIVDVEVLDHIILTRDGHLSVRETTEIWNEVR